MLLKKINELDFSKFDLVPFDATSFYTNISISLVHQMINFWMNYDSTKELFLDRFKNGLFCFMSSWCAKAGSGRNPSLPKIVGRGILKVNHQLITRKTFQMAKLSSNHLHALVEDLLHLPFTFKLLALHHGVARVALSCMEAYRVRRASPVLEGLDSDDTGVARGPGHAVVCLRLDSGVELASCGEKVLCGVARLV